MIAAGTGLFFGLQFLLGLWRLSRTSGGMENKFSRIARDDYLGFLVLQNLHAVTAYLVLTAAAAWLIQPFVGALLGRARPRWRVVASGFGLSVIVHGWFVLRLVETRPYFLKDIDFGHWYYQILDAVPEALQPALFGFLFSVVPVAVVLFACLWHFRSGGVARASAIGVAAVAATAFAYHGLVKIRPSASPVADGARPWNVLIVGSDSLRGDRIGANGYTPPRINPSGTGGVSPTIDELAARSFNFHHAYTPIASTLESGIALMSSQYPHTYGIRHMYPDRGTLERALGSIDPIARKLSAAGYDTAAIGDWCAGYYQIAPLGFETVEVSSFDNFKIYMSQAVIMAHFVIPLYFDHEAGYRLFPQIRSFAQFVTPEVVTQRVEDRLADRARDGRPFFWHVFYSCNHLPFRSPEPYRGMFVDPAYDGPHRNGVDFDIDAFIGGTDLEAKSEALPEHEVAQIRALYDGTTRMFDDQLRRILAALGTRGLAERTIVVINSDHGDDLYEPGVTFGHGLTMNGGLQSFHIPMIVHVPGKGAARIEEAVRLIDLAPTLADMLGLERSQSWEGKSFAGWIDGTETPVWRPFYGETGFPFIQFPVEGARRPKLPAMDGMTMIDPSFNFQFVLRSEFEQPLIDAKQRVLRTQRWKLVCTPTLEGGRHFALFRLSDDPHGLNNLAHDRADVLVPMRTALERWMDQRHESSIAEIFPAGEPD